MMHMRTTLILDDEHSKGTTPDRSGRKTRGRSCRPSSAHCAALGGADLAPKRTIEHEGPEGNHRRDECDQPAAQWPAALAAGVVQGTQEYQEEHAMHASNDADRERETREILERHRDEKQDQEGRAFKECDEPEVAERCHDVKGG